MTTLGVASTNGFPATFGADADGRVKILSYINNLHPVKHGDLYNAIERIFERFVLLFDSVLSCLANSSGPARRLNPSPTHSNRDLDMPPLRPSVPESLELQPEIATPFTLKNSVFQVIVKIAEIGLTPEKPSYPGGPWHAEGSDAEQIVATGIYYFGCENIAESVLSFRVVVAEPPCQQDDTLRISTQYGLLDESQRVQALGAMTVVEDRCVVFPNTLQLKVEPFELADPTKPGARKMLVFFLVDPTKPIPSTLVIPPQQEKGSEVTPTPTSGRTT
ncbi:hypothetical protein ATCC90586_005613 [Pythium insidiosum]|nr:hypothetical protein ATCC90586_005613 [Pythium insidiosum]